MNKKILPLVLMAGAVSMLLPSCGNMATSSGGLAAYNAYDRPAKTPKNRSKVRVKVSLKNQMAYVMEGSDPLLVMPVTVGKASKPTPRGNFRIFNKQKHRRANTHGYAMRGGAIRQCYLRNKPAGWSFKGTPMPYWCEFKGAYGFHTGWMKPFPATHGCLRMHKNVAPKFFHLVSRGTPVNISYTQPEDATIGRNVPRPPDSTPFPDPPLSTMVSNQFFQDHKAPTYN